MQAVEQFLSTMWGNILVVIGIVLLSVSMVGISQGIYADFDPNLLYDMQAWQSWIHFVQGAALILVLIVSGILIGCGMLNFMWNFHRYRDRFRLWFAANVFNH